MFNNVLAQPYMQRLVSSQYDRPQKTYTDTLQTNIKMKEKHKTVQKEIP